MRTFTHLSQLAMLVIYVLCQECRETELTSFAQKTKVGWGLDGLTPTKCNKQNVKTIMYSIPNKQ